MARSVTERLEDLMLEIGHIERRVGGLDARAFERLDYDTLALIAWSLLVVGEAIKALPPELMGRHRAVDWRGLMGLRDVLAHQYFRLDHALLWTAIREDLPRLRGAVTAELVRASHARDDG